MKWALWTGLQSGGSGTVGGLGQERWLKYEQIDGQAHGRWGGTAAASDIQADYTSLSACMCLGFQVSIRWVHPTVRPASRTNINAMLRVGTYIHAVSRGEGGGQSTSTYTRTNPDPTKDMSQERARYLG